jgi:hypothetical protein
MLPLKTHNKREKNTIWGSQFAQPTIKFALRRVKTINFQVKLALQSLQFALLPVKFNQPSRKINIQSHKFAQPSLQFALLLVTRIVQCHVTIKKGENILGFFFKL